MFFMMRGGHPEAAPGRLEREGSLLYFCSLGCQDQYEKEQAEQSEWTPSAGTPMGYSRSRQPEEAR